MHPPKIATRIICSSALTRIAPTHLQTNCTRASSPRSPPHINKQAHISHKHSAIFSTHSSADYLYAGIFPKIATRVVTVFGERAVPSALTFIDQCIHHPILYFPSFYLLRGYSECLGY